MNCGEKYGDSYILMVTMTVGERVRMRMGMFTEAMVMPVKRLLPKHAIHCIFDFGQKRNIANIFSLFFICRLLLTVHLRTV